MIYRRVIIESPYAGDVEGNLKFLRACMAHSLSLGEAPFASHGLYTQPGVLNDLDPKEREAGINAGFAWREAAGLTVFYVDLGWSSGMLSALEHCKVLLLPYEERGLPGITLQSLKLSL